MKSGKNKYHHKIWIESIVHIYLLKVNFICEVIDFFILQWKGIHKMSDEISIPFDTCIQELLSGMRQWGTVPHPTKKVIYKYELM